jgi:hypothetical protein
MPQKPLDVAESRELAERSLDVTVAKADLDTMRSRDRKMNARAAAPSVRNARHEILVVQPLRARDRQRNAIRIRRNR